jgi:Protein of unknown function (DUF3305)
MKPDAVMPISVVLERRAGKTVWQDYVWRPLGVLPQIADERGRVLAAGKRWTHFYGGALNLELFRGETEGYLTNLSQPGPVVYVVLRRNEEADGGLEFEPFLATVCSYEAMGYSVSSDEIVEGVPMPPDVVAWVGEFVARHHVEMPFKKRRNKSHEDDYGGKRPHRAAAQEEFE